MKNLKSLSDIDLRDATLKISAHERKITAEVIEHLVEVEKRKLHLAWGYPNLFEYVVKELKYSESAAYRRIQAARTIMQVPEMARSLESGDLKLSQVAKLQTVIKQSEKQFGEKISLLAQKELLQKLIGKNSHETEQILEQSLLLDADREPVEKETCFERHKGTGMVEMTFTISKETFEQLKRIKEIYAHKNPSADWVDILKMMMADVAKKRDLNLQQRPRPKITHSNTAAVLSPTSANKKNTHIRPQFRKRKPIPPQIKRMVMQKSKGRCEFRSEDGRMCGSTFLIEIDHIHPVSFGGANEIKNLRTLCRNHNQYAYIKLNPATDSN